MALCASAESTMISCAQPIRGLFYPKGLNVIIMRRQDIKATYAIGCYGSSSSTGSSKPLFLRRKRRRFRDLDADSSWAEPWKLNLIEAYFLINEKQINVEMVCKDGNIMLDNVRAWKEFSMSSVFASPRRFACLYATYYSLKQQGWVVKMGQTYGGNFVVYQGDPDYFHSQFCVLVRDADDPEPCKFLSLQ